MRSAEELNDYISQYIQGGFWPNDMRVLKEEIEKLKPGDVYVEIGVDEGKSARVAHEYADPDVFKFFIDIHDVLPHSASIGRGPWMEQEKMVGLGKKGFYIHGDADEFVKIFLRVDAAKFISLIFIDGHHDYDSVRQNTLSWEPFVKKGGVILFHDIDHPDTLRWLNEHYKNNWEALHGKVGRIRK